MNNEKNKRVWLKKCEDTLRMGGRSDLTIKNYKFAIKRFLSRYDDKTNIKKLTIDNLTKYFKKEFLDKNLSAASYNVNLHAIRYFYLVCFDRNISKIKEMTITAEEFIRRFLLHVLPDNFAKIKHYGILSNKNKKNNIKFCRFLISKIISNEFVTTITRTFKQFKCEKCGSTNFSYSFVYDIHRLKFE